MEKFGPHPRVQCVPAIVGDVERKVRCEPCPACSQGHSGRWKDFTQVLGSHDGATGDVFLICQRKVSSHVKRVRIWGRLQIWVWQWLIIMILITARQGRWSPGRRDGFHLHVLQVVIQHTVLAGRRWGLPKGSWCTGHSLPRPIEYWRFNLQVSCKQKGIPNCQKRDSKLHRVFALPTRVLAASRWRLAAAAARWQLLSGFPA